MGGGPRFQRRAPELSKKGEGNIPGYLRRWGERLSLPLASAFILRKKMKRVTRDGGVVQSDDWEPAA